MKARNRLPQRILFLAAAAAIIGLNIAYAVIINRSVELLTADAKIDGNPLLFVKPDDNTTIVVTKDNSVIFYDRNLNIVSSSKFDETIALLKIDPYTHNINMATSKGNFYTFDSQLNQISVYKYPGRVICFDYADENSVYLLTGSGTTSASYYIRRIDTNGKELYAVKTGFQTNKVITMKDAAVFGTVNARVDALDANGKRVWEARLHNSITGLAYFEQTDKIFAIDTKGNVSLLDSAGKVQWSNKISNYAMMNVSYNGGDFVLASDSDGAVFMMDVKGNVILTQQLGSRVSDIYVAESQDFIFCTSTGQFYTIHSGAIRNTSLNGTIGAIVLWASVILGAAALVLLAFSFDGSAKKARWVIMEIYKSRLGYLMILPTFVLISIFNIFPVVAAFAYSFMRYTLAMPAKYIGLANYKEMLSDAYLRMGIGNMLIFLVTDIIKTLVMPLLAAELVFWLHKEKNRHRLRTMFVIPTVVPGVVAILLWKNIYNSDMGLLNNILTLLGHADLQRSWLGDRATALWALIFMGIPWIGAFAFLVYFGGLIGIPSDLYDAAKIDGANTWRRFRHIDISLLTPQFRILLFFTYIGSIQNYQSIYLMTKGGPGGATYVPAYQMYQKLSAEADYGYASAIGVMLFLVVLIGTLLNQTLIKKTD